MCNVRRSHVLCHKVAASIDWSVALCTFTLQCCSAIEEQALDLLTACVQVKAFLRQELRAERLSIVTDSLKQMQLGTRILQHACAEAKARKLAAITRLVPKVKRSLEQFVHTARVLLAELPSGSFSVSIGNLKHKNLQGEEVDVEMDEETENAEEDGDGAADNAGCDEDLGSSDGGAAHDAAAIKTEKAHIDDGIAAADNEEHDAAADGDENQDANGQGAADKPHSKAPRNSSVQAKGAAPESEKATKLRRPGTQVGFKKRKIAP